MTEQPLATVTALRPGLNLMYERMLAEAERMVARIGLAETVLTLAAVAGEAAQGPPPDYDEHSDIRRRAWREGVYAGITALAVSMDGEED